MAEEHLLNATVTRLRDRLSLKESECGVQPDGQPPAACGQFYLAASANGWGLDNPEHELLEGNYAVLLTLTQRCGVTPQDRAGKNIVAKIGTGLLALARAAALACHGSYTILDEANAAIGASENGFTEPLRLQSGGVSPVIKKPPSWLWADGKTTQQGPAALVVEVRLAGARRYEALPDADHD